MTETHTLTHTFVRLRKDVLTHLCHLQPKMTPQERLKLRMQKALNKQCEYSPAENVFVVFAQEMVTGQTTELL